MNDTKKIERNFFQNTYTVKRSIGRWVFKFFRFAFILGLSYQFLFPVFYMVVTTFQNPSVVDPSVIWIPKNWSSEGIRGAIENLKFFDSLFLTAVISLFSTIASMISCSMVGYGFARFQFKGKSLVFALVVLTIIVPPQALTMSSFLNYWYFDFGGILSLFGASVNLLNTPWVFIAPAMLASGLRGGLFIFIFRQFFAQQPKELEEASKIDGCGPFRTFVRVMIPMAAPAFVTVLLFSLVWHWNDIYSASVYFTDEVKPLSVMLYYLKDSLEASGLITANVTAGRMYMMAGVLLAISPLIILYLFTQKFFTESIERTGIVG